MFAVVNPTLTEVRVLLLHYVCERSGSKFITMHRSKMFQHIYLEYCILKQHVSRLTIALCP